eukprot:scaffold319_cov244-Pinguiococcus_pyrenoidosus.AAC.1
MPRVSRTTAPLAFYPTRPCEDARKRVGHAKATREVLPRLLNPNANLHRERIIHRRLWRELLHDLCHLLRSRLWGSLRRLFAQRPTLALERSDLLFLTLLGQRRGAGRRRSRLLPCDRVAKSRRCRNLLLFRNELVDFDVHVRV